MTPRWRTPARFRISSRCSSCVRSALVVRHKSPHLQRPLEVSQMGYPINWAPPEPDVPHATPETERYVILIEVWDTEQNDSFEAGWCVSSHRFTEWEHAKVYLEYLSWRPGLHGDCYTRQRIGRGWGLLAILDLKTSEVHMMEDVLGHGFQEVAEGAV